MKKSQKPFTVKEFGDIVVGIVFDSFNCDVAIVDDEMKTEYKIRLGSKRKPIVCMRRDASGNVTYVKAKKSKIKV